jgi:RNA processing factor Prp31
MARSQTDLLAKLVDKGEEALARVAEAPTTMRMIDSMTSLRTRVDDLQKRVRGLDVLERRVEVLEKKVEQLSKKPPAKPAAARKPPAKPAAKKTP